jgi:hypothetical protein
MTHASPIGVFVFSVFQAETVISARRSFLENMIRLSSTRAYILCSHSNIDIHDSQLIFLLSFP